MANETLIQATELSAAPATDDYLYIWDSSSGQLKRISVANFISTYITGAGVLATGGFTLTVPQSLTAAGRNVTNTFSALQTFSAGLTFGGTTLSTYTASTWTPAITGSASNPTITYTSQSGTYVRIGNLVIYVFNVGITSISGGSGDIRISLPLSVASGGSGALQTALVNLTTPAGVVFSPNVGNTFGRVQTIQDNADRVVEQISSLTAGSSFAASGAYITS